MKRILTLIMTMVFISCIRAAEELPDLETKVALELGLEKRLKTILEEITGTNKISISINVHLYTQKESVTLNRMQPEKKKKSDEVILPGVPMQDKLGEAGEPILAPLTFEENRTMIKRLTANVFLDSRISDQMVKMVERVTKALLGIDPSRGDELVIERIPFGTWNLDWKAMLQPPDLYWVSAIVLSLCFLMFGSIFLFGPFRGFFGQLVNSIASLAEKSSGAEAAAGASGSGSHTIDILHHQTPEKSGAKDEDKQKRLFGFIGEYNLNDLIFLCKKEKPESIAIIASYITPLLSARLIHAMDKNTQARIAQELSQVKENLPDSVQALERKIKERIDYLVGGEDRLQQIINYSDTALQQSIMQSLKSTNPVFAEKVRNLIFSFENIVNLDGNTLQMLIRHINPTIFSQVLKSMPDDFQKKIYGLLPEGLSERLAQEMELGKSLTPKRIEEEKRIVVQMVKNFEQQGLIDLSKIAKE